MTIYDSRQHGPLTPGTRVRNYGERFPRAYTEGTATILRMTREWPDGTYEYDVRKDSGEVASWNDVHPISSWEPDGNG